MQEIQDGFMEETGFSKFKFKVHVGDTHQGISTQQAGHAKNNGQWEHHAQ